MKKIAALILFAFSMQVHAGLFSDDEARQQIVELRAQVQASDARVANAEAASKRTLELLNQIAKLQEEVAQLRGKIEVLQFNQDEAIKRQRDLFLDLDARVRVFESKEMAAEQARQAQVAAQAAAQAAAEQAAQQAAAEQQQVNDAAALIKDGKNKEGIAALAKFIAANPNSSLLPEANYWTAVAYAANKDYKAAKNTFDGIVKNSPKDPRAPDALLGMASIAQTLKDTKLSRRYLAMILESYPDSEAAKTAKKALAASK